MSKPLESIYFAPKTPSGGHIVLESDPILLDLIPLDNNGPIVLSLASDQVVEGQSFAKLENNSFIATFRDDSGVKPSGIKLHAADSIYAADSCSKSIDIWQCKWDNIDFFDFGASYKSPGKIRLSTVLS